MEATATDERETSQGLDTLVSDDEPNALAAELQTEDQETPSDTGEEEPSTEGEEPPATLTPQERHALLQAKIDASEPLTTAEKQEYASLEQSERDRRTAEANRRESLRQDRERVAQAQSKFHDDVYQAVNDEIDTARQEGRGVSLSLLRAALKSTTDGLMRDVEPMVLRPHEDLIGAAYFAMAGNNQQARDVWDSASTLPDKINLWADLYAQRRIQETTDGGRVSKLEAENAQLKQEIQKLTAGRAKSLSPSANGKESSRSVPNLKNLTSPQEVARLMSTPEGYAQLKEAMATQRK